MSNASETQALIAGAGPIGVTAAIELARRGVACRIVPAGASAYVMRPNGCLSLAAPRVAPAELVTHLRATFVARSGDGVAG